MKAYKTMTIKVSHDNLLDRCNHYEDQGWEVKFITPESSRYDHFVVLEMQNEDEEEAKPTGFKLRDYTGGNI